MKEHEIRPAGIFDEYLRLSALDVEQYFAQSNERISRNCPSCGGDVYQKAFEKNNFWFVRCSDCDSLYVNPCPDPAQLAEFYQESPSQKFWANTFFPSVASARQEKIFRPRAAKIKALLDQHDVPNPDRVMDVGAGSGAMLEELRDAGIGNELFAIEPTPDLATVCQSKGFSVFEGFADDAAKDKSLVGSASFVMSFEVIEHVISPFDFLGDISALARPGGIILITGLCGSGFDIQVLGKNSKAVSPPHHLNFISRKGVTLLLERCGLQEISFSTPGVLDVDIVRNSFAGDPATVSDKFLRQLFLQDDEAVLQSFQQFITSNNQSSHMWILARKPAS
jgi:SAM-dependent methyltransferase